ncbi:unnamed protein product [Nezara viridula]|uniref:Uncharacterized protein n=1 Tax=Nezara viridula TaxID=85310 RepID=A0A9P0HD60_NEZVI|nr:unnamed protein product [Nezara viridula]
MDPGNVSGKGGGDLSAPEAGKLVLHHDVICRRRHKRESFGEQRASLAPPSRCILDRNGQYMKWIHGVDTWRCPTRRTYHNLNSWRLRFRHSDLVVSLAGLKRGR